MSRVTVLTVLFLASVPAVAALVAVWAAKSRRHWFGRALAVWGCIAVLVPIRVYEPAMVFGLALPLIVGLVRVPDVLREMRGASDGRRLRFGLMDICLVMVLVGLSLAVVRGITRGEVRVGAYEVAVPTLAMAGLAGAGYWLVAGSRRVIAFIVLCSLVPLAAWLIWPKIGWLFAIETLNLGFWNAFGSALAGNNRHYFQGLAVCAAGLVAYTVMVVSGLVVIQLRLHRAPTSHPWLAVKGLVGVVTAVGVAWVYWQFARSSPFPPNVDGENHRTRILEIARKVYLLNPWQKATNNVRPLSAHDPKTSADLSQFYDELLILLTTPNAMPFDPNTDSTPDFIKTVSSDRIFWQRGVCQSFQQEWLDAESRGDRERALDFVFANWRLGAMGCRNGGASECQCGYAYMGVSRAYFFDKRDALSDEQIARLSTELERAEAEHESLESILQRDKAQYGRAFGWQWRVTEVISPGQRDRQDRRWLRHSYDQWLTLNRLLITDLAIRQYRREHQDWPVSLASLVPKYLKLIPIDPFSDAPLLYGTTAENFVLYSVGQDRADNGGRFGDFSRLTREIGFDLDLDTFTREYGSVVSPLLSSGAAGTK